MADDNRNSENQENENQANNKNKATNQPTGGFADHNYGTKAKDGNTANYDSQGREDINDAGGNLDKGQAHDDINGGGDILGRQGGGRGEAQGLGKVPSSPVSHTPRGAESDKDTGRGTHAGGLGDSHSGFKGNHNGNDGTGGGKSSGSAGHGSDPEQRKQSSGGTSGKDDVNNPNIAGRGGKH
ncbi:hypothetical protein TH61_11655 [Rufibacter sp. DG15C]|uniref:hypothetical protein n=1 Tax=Rufibacter sp. DG15C TaxID=1379909 RepID=UPI00078D9810|nr:hypothetical protein [Rufibacter sp. DG15C]AMM51706.1 hypothetical protein TH61_11655 [Rufibacter sp. DG15C]